MTRYIVEAPHARHVAYLALIIYDQLEFLMGHSCSQPYREYLETAALLHDIGYFISKKGHHRHSRWILTYSKETQNWNDGARQCIADLAFFHRKSLTSKKLQYLRRSSRLLALSVVLRIADGLDRAHRQDVSIANITVTGKTVTIAVRRLTDDAYEHLIRIKAEGFSQAFGRTLKIQRLLDP
jgi:exopolyphosphatase/guanosine-5'-triphosphate,3'-diphosphate pyrophosphatase